MTRTGVIAVAVVALVITASALLFDYGETVLYRTHSVSWTEVRDYQCGDEWVTRTVTIRNMLEHTRAGIHVTQEVTGDDCPVEATK